MSRPNFEERLLRQFYDWELWGRGHLLWPEPVELEPPFHPFFGHYTDEDSVRIDDGRHATFLSRLADRASALFRATTPELPVAEPFGGRSPFPDYSSAAFSEIQVVVPHGTAIGLSETRQFLMTLGRSAAAFSFEIIGTAEAIVVVFACPVQSRLVLRNKLRAFFSDCVLMEQEHFLHRLWDQAGSAPFCVVDLGLRNEFVRPLKTFNKLDPDPLTGLIGSMAELAQGQVAVVQVMFAPAVNQWADSIMRAASDGAGGPFFADDRSLLSQAGSKVSAPIFAVMCRVGVRSLDIHAGRTLLGSIAGAFGQFADPVSNELVPLSNAGYDDVAHVHDLLARKTRRCGMLLNCDELASLVHFPSASVRTKRMLRDGGRTKEPPGDAVGHRLVLGKNYHDGATSTVSVRPEDRMRHIHIIGVSGTGKSSLLLRMIAQDLQQGEGIAVVDPHGDLIDQILPLVPESRMGDVILLDPSDAALSAGLNILSANSEQERILLSSDLVAMFRRLSTSWGDQMTSVLGNAILALLESDRPRTLFDLRRFLIEAEFRKEILSTIEDPEIAYYWTKQFPLLKGLPQSSILTRLDTFLRPKVIRNLVSGSGSYANLTDIMGSGKILLAKLSHGLIGEENARLLGMLLVSKLNQTALARQAQPAQSRRPFYLYIDEFHNFITPSLSAMLAGARKYGLGLVCAHQDLQQLQKDADVASAVLSNPHTRICFRVGDSDAKKLESGFSFFTAADLQALPTGRAICRMGGSDGDFNLEVEPLELCDELEIQKRKDAIHCRLKHRHAPEPPSEPSVMEQAPPLALRRKPEPGKAKHVEASIAPVEEEGTSKGSSAARRPIPPSPPMLGRGGPQHTYLQQLVKRWAEDKGYRVTIEKPLFGGVGFVDLVIENDTTAVACEISISTTPQHEVQNIAKCFAAGFSSVVILGGDRKTLRAIQAAAEQLVVSDAHQLQYMLVDELFSYLESQQMGAKDNRIHGYRVKVTRRTDGDSSAVDKRAAILRNLLNSRGNPKVQKKQ